MVELGLVRGRAAQDSEGQGRAGHIYVFHVVIIATKQGIVELGLVRGRAAQGSEGQGRAGHIYVFHVVMMCYTSTYQHKTIRPCKHYHNIRRVHRRFCMSSCFSIMFDKTPY